MAIEGSALDAGSTKTREILCDAIVDAVPNGARSRLQVAAPSLLQTLSTFTLASNAGGDGRKRFTAGTLSSLVVR